ncbi:hypothetical protein [Cohnella caldifontis]|uniref:hypothetical protein n=1 Tax=Cohnella caldifontis TaxID=3027471 RepID=UPI0023EB554C|nr:hypothetical protein [Cohnella sp. YIM B05605]
MNKRRTSSLSVLLILAFLLAACSSGASSWEDEEFHETGTERILSDDVNALWTLSDAEASGTEAVQRIRLETRKRDGQPIENFDLNHEKLLHLMVVSKDLSYFNHIHPYYKGGGVFEIDNAFPAGGEYRLVADFKPAEGDAMTKMAWIRVPGEPADPVPVVPDESLEKTADGLRAGLTIDRLSPNADTTLAFTLSDAATGQPIRDLQPYLGAIGHVVILSEDGERYVHVHAEEGQGSGPEAVFSASFPGSGIYKIWGQFQRNDRVTTFSYVVRVP